ncbi:MAG: glycosyltransferase family 2 protein [Candidatus Aenigmarchaeota archaeon]|nr:glycosyltransferase family 2 protein [Candidatus Aenigmarchaeota archaeon]
MKIAVIPAYNEERTISYVVEKTKKYVDSIIVIDDCSRDSTPEIVKTLGVISIRHKENMGLGSSLRDGFAKALEISRSDDDIIITLDADGQHDPADIAKFVEKIKQGYDFVLGERDLRKYPLRKKFGNFVLNLATNFISGTHLKDTESGFRAFTAAALGKLYLKARRYEIAVEIIFEAGRNNLRAANVKIDIPVYVKGVSVMDGIKNFRYLLSRRRRNFMDYFADIKYVFRKKI